MSRAKSNHLMSAIARWLHMNFRFQRNINYISKIESEICELNLNDTKSPTRVGEGNLSRNN